MTQSLWAGRGSSRGIVDKIREVKRGHFFGEKLLGSVLDILGLRGG